MTKRLNMKIGKSIVMVLVAVMILSSIVAAGYAVINNLYAANSDFSFEKDSRGNIKEYETEVGKTFKFDFYLPRGVNKSNVQVTEDDDFGLLQINKNYTAKGLMPGSGTLKASVIINGKRYEATTKFTVTGDGANSSNNINNSSASNNVNNLNPTGEFNINDDINTNNINNQNSNKNSSLQTNITSSKSGYKLSFLNDEKTVAYDGKDITFSIAFQSSGIRDSKAISWSSSDTKVAEVNRNKVTVKGVGIAIITAEYEDVSDSFTLISNAKGLVINNVSNNENLTDTTYTMKVGDSLSIHLKENGQDINNSNIKFTSTNGNVCGIDENGYIEALKTGTVTIKGMLKNNNRSSGQFRIRVVEDDDTSTGNNSSNSNTVNNTISNSTFSFPIDPKTNKIKKYTLANSFILGEGYQFGMILPEGVNQEDVTFSTNKPELIECNGSTIKVIGMGSGKLTGTIIVNGRKRTATTDFQVVASEEELQKLGGTEIQYINLNYSETNKVTEVGSNITLKPNVDTNIPPSQYKILYSSSNENIATVTNLGRVKAISTGETEITAYLENNPSIKATIKVKVEEKVVKVSSLKLVSNIEKKSGMYQVYVDEPTSFEFEVSPANATIKDYVLEVDNTEDFMVLGTTVIALNPDKKTNLIAKSLDSGEKTTRVQIHSNISNSQLEQLTPITDVKQINVAVGDSVTFRNVQSNRTVLVSAKSGRTYYTLDKDSDTITITGKSQGSGSISVSYDSNKIEIPINVTNISEEQRQNIIPVQQLVLPINDITGKTKDYVNDYTLDLGEYNKIDVTVLPENATNKDLKYTISNTNDFTLSADGGINPNTPNKKATLTISSVSNPEVSTTVQIASSSNNITGVKFAKEYIGDEILDINESRGWGFNPIITLSNNTVYDPTKQDLSNNTQYQALKSKLTLKSNNPEYLKVEGLEGLVVSGTSGSGTITYYVTSNPNISDTVRFETNGILNNVSIQNARFARSEYNESLTDPDMRFLPTITLSNSTILDPSKQTDPMSWAKDNEEYKYYLSQLEIVNDSNNDVLKVTSDDSKLSIHLEKIGTSKLGLRLKGSSYNLHTATINVTQGKNDDTNNYTAVINPIDQSTTTNNKNLNITRIEFVDRSYVLDGDFGWGFKPIITLSDGTKLSSTSENQDVYNYYLSLTELFLNNDISNSTIDFGVVEVNNNILPRTLMPLKDGKVFLSVGVKSNSLVYDTVPVTVSIGK